MIENLGMYPRASKLGFVGSSVAFFALSSFFLHLLLCMKLEGSKCFTNLSFPNMPAIKKDGQTLKIL